MSRLRRASGAIWVVAVPFALLVGLAIGGMPDASEDVPLKDRNVVEAPAATTTTTPGG